jgi:hypothetical protein
MDNNQADMKAWLKKISPQRHLNLEDNRRAKMQLRRALLLVVLGAVFCFPNLARAWTLSGAFYENGTGPNGVNYGKFDKIEIFMMDGSIFNAPFIQNASLPGGWSSNLVDSKYTLVTGTLTNLLGPFTVELPDPSTTSHVLDYLVWDDNTLLYSQRITWNGTGSGGTYNGWSYPLLASDGSTYTINGVTGTYDRAPLPSTLILLGSGLLGLIGLRRKSKSGH